jgi:hypothetical protein
MSQVNPVAAKKFSGEVGDGSAGPEDDRPGTVITQTPCTPAVSGDFTRKTLDLNVSLRVEGFAPIRRCNRSTAGLLSAFRR